MSAVNEPFRLSAELGKVWGDIGLRQSGMGMPMDVNDNVGLALLHLWDMFSLDSTPQEWIEELEAAGYPAIAEALREANANQ